MFRTKGNRFHGDLLARHIALRLQQTDDAIAVLLSLRAELPALYHGVIDNLTAATKRNDSIINALTIHSNYHLQQLGSWLGEPSDLPLTARLAEWQNRSSLLQRIGVRVHQEGNERLAYFATLATVFSIVCLMWLMFIAPTYAELFESISPGTTLPSMSMLMITLSSSEHAVAATLRFAIAMLPFAAWAAVFLLRRQLNRLSRGQKLPWWLTKAPVLNRLPALRALIFAPDVRHTDAWKKNPLLTESEVLGLQLAQNGHYLADEQKLLLALPESEWADRTVAPLRRATMFAIAALWCCIGFFLIASYQPIFQLGAAV